MLKPLLYKGRGSISNAAGRFEKQTSQLEDDGWGSADQDLAPLPTEILLDASKSVITYNDSPDIPFDRSINPYRGCEHGCIYCFARPTHTYLGFSAGLDFETRIQIKPDAAKLLCQELSKAAYRCAPIALGTNTDPYQPLERRHTITRQILEVLAETRHPCAIITKSALIERDFDLLTTMARQNLVTVGVSLTTLDKTLALSLEPRAVSPARRLALIGALSAADIPVHVMTAPLIPGLNDHELEQILAAAQQVGAMSASYVMLRLPLEVAALFEEWLQQHYPLKAAHVMNLIKECHGGKTYDSAFKQRMRGTGVYANMLNQRFRLICKRLQLDKPLAPLRTDLFRKPSANGQMSFDFFD